MSCCVPISLKPKSRSRDGIFIYSHVTCAKESSIQFQNLWTPDLDAMLAGEKAKPENVKRPVKIAIVGAGPAGMVAAYELQKIEKAEIHVFERSGRVGGRILTIGASGNLATNCKDEKFWTTDKTYGEAGGMRLPLPPQDYFEAKYKEKDVNLNIASMSEDDINKLVHGKAPYDFVEDKDFPQHLVRHYIKELELPVKRFNMNVAAATVDCTFNPPSGKAAKMTGYFVRNDDGLLVEDGKELSEKFMAFLMENGTADDKKWLEEVGDLSSYFDQCITEVVRAEICDLTYDKWNKFLEEWNISYKKCLMEVKNATRKLDFKPWPEHIIDFYADVFRVGMSSEICHSIIEIDLGNWWQDSGMYCPHFGMHTIYEKPKSTPSNTNVQPKDGLRDKLTSKVKLHFNRKVTQITLRDDKKIRVCSEEAAVVCDFAGGQAQFGDFDAVIVTVPPPHIGGDKGIKLTGFPSLPTTVDFPNSVLSKNMYEFDSLFWNAAKCGTNHNKGGFKMDDQNGFVTRSISMKEAHLSQLRYSTGDEGNVVMNYEFDKNAVHASDVCDERILNFMGEFHTCDVSEKAIINTDKNTEAVGKFRAPWENLSSTPYTKEHVQALTKFCNYDGAKGLYFAGDGWSFKPQWQEGAMYTSLHSVFRLINDFNGANAEKDPFVYTKA